MAGQARCLKWVSIMIGELTDAQIEQLLHEQVIGRIGCHVAGRTYVVPITYVYDAKTRSIISHTGGGQKVQMMRENPRVCFEVEDLRHLPKWKSAIIHGLYEELEGATAEAALENLHGRLLAGPPSQHDMPDEGAGIFDPEIRDPRVQIVFRITIEEKTGRCQS
jgi:uncharacterized protein